MSTRYLAFVGTRGDDEGGIDTYRFDPGDGVLEPIATAIECVNPSFLAIHPSGRFLYAVEQVQEGRLAAFSIDGRTGLLTRLNDRATESARPCHVSVDPSGRFALVAHHTGGSVSVFSIDEQGHLGGLTDRVERDGSGPDPDRQTRSRPHAVVPGPDGRFFYVPDLGADRLWVYVLDRESGTLDPQPDLDVVLHPGAGPRHLTFHPSGLYAFLIDELDSTIVALERDPGTGALAISDTASTLPSSYRGDNQAADVHVHPSGQRVYGSNRIHDSIAVFAFDEEGGRVRPVGHQSTQGAWPRNFAIDPTGTYLFAENQRSDCIVTFRIDGEDGTLADTGERTAVRRPICMRFLPDLGD